MKQRFTIAVRTFFILTFFALILHGINSGGKSDGYIPVENPYPVSAEIIDTQKNTSVEPEVFVSSINAAVDFPGMDAGAAALICADTGDILYLRNGDEKLGMASTTKIMTALVVLEHCNPDTVVTVGKESCGIEGSSIYLVPGENITVRDLLYGLLLESGNDAACALAVACSGSTEEFTRLMNLKADELGLVNTNFTNPHGLSDPEHYTTARELALIARTAMKNPLFREIVGTKTYIVTDKDGNPVKFFANHNRMLFSDKDVTGIKTGYTLADGRCLVTSREKNGTEFIAVTLNDRNDFHDHAEMLDFAFKNYKTVTLLAVHQCTTRMT